MKTTADGATTQAVNPRQPLAMNTSHPRVVTRGHLPPGSEAGILSGVGVDIGVETLKAVALRREHGKWQIASRWRTDHGKRPGELLVEHLRSWQWEQVDAAAVTGRLGRLTRLTRIPLRHAQVRGARFLAGDGPLTVLSVGGRGFSVLELRQGGTEVYRENARCSQGTGNFLRQLVERLSLDVETADALCADVPDPLPLSGRCPVILKTDMTHLANRGENRARVLAGLFDAVCENVMALVKPGVSPSRVLLAGGVMLSRRVRRVLSEQLSCDGFEVIPVPPEDALFLEAIGAAILGAERCAKPPGLDRLRGHVLQSKCEEFPGLAAYRPKVRRLTPPATQTPPRPGTPLVLGFDIGSTGSKLVALDAAKGAPCWEGYRRTLGDPVGAAQALVREFLSNVPAPVSVHAFGVTGSGREIVGSLLVGCASPRSVFVLNEIAAHAEGAVYFDPRVDTLFEIGGQDAKYVRLSGGQVVDCAMNEACSAGTGSFIEEQGLRFEGVRDVAGLGEEALAAKTGVSLGQHCSVFMAEVIDEAVSAGVERGAILAGLHDSVIQNYLHRVKGSRPVGQVVFCQGMPFASDALAAAVARQTGAEVIVPPNPGTVGALGIALLAAREVAWKEQPAFELGRFLEARVTGRDTVVCRSRKGCGGSGNCCRLERLDASVGAQTRRFVWGGACALHDRGVQRVHLPDLAPDPFRERAALVADLIARLPQRGGRPVVAMPDGFMLKELLPFFATFIHALGCDIRVATEGGRSALKDGIRQANVPSCAPLQLFRGVVANMIQPGTDILFLPMLRSLPSTNSGSESTLCPLVQAAPAMVAADLGLTSATGTSQASQRRPRVLSPVFDAGRGGMDSEAFRQACRALALDLGSGDERWEPAFDEARAAQQAFEAACTEAGARALAFCRDRFIPAVVVLGRPYTLHNTVLNSNVPALLREQGAVAIPVDCLPIPADLPSMEAVYWDYARRILRAAEFVRRSPGLYAVCCSNYSCGPDSFNLHFLAYVMEGKPFAVVETDGHAGDAGTRTRMEAFLYCARRHTQRDATETIANRFGDLRVGDVSFATLRPRADTLLIPRLGPAPEAFAACLQGRGYDVECLPEPDTEAAALGRRHTSGRECLPMSLTLGSLLQRLEKDRDSRRSFVFGMPSCQGPCRFGVYNLLNRIVLERLGWAGRVRIWSPQDQDYFAGLPPGFAALVYVGFVATDLLLAGLHHTRPVEGQPGLAQEIYDRHLARLLAVLRTSASGSLTLAGTAWEVLTGRLYGVTEVVTAAAREFRRATAPETVGPVRPTVLVAGEIYVRCNEAANGNVIRELEQRGLRARLAPFTEWIDYAAHMTRVSGRDGTLAHAIERELQARIARRLAQAMELLWGRVEPEAIPDVLAVGGEYVPEALAGEAVLTVGSGVHAWRHGTIHGVVNVSPHECMPGKIAESQFFHAAEREGLRTLSLALNGGPADPEALDRFAFEISLEREPRGPRKRS